jgi:hypothetical protein
MRIIVAAITAGLAVGYSAPAFAQAYSYAACEALAEQRDSTTGRQHRDFIRECMAGKIPMTVPPVTHTTAHVLEAESFGYCQALAEQRASTTGRQHREFIKECMAGRIPGR